MKTGVTLAQVPAEHWAIITRIRAGEAGVAGEAIAAGIPLSIVALASTGWTDEQLAEQNDTYLRARTVARARHTLGTATR